MPAAAVIPAPIAYTKFVAVKKLVVGSQVQAGGPARAGYCPYGLSPRSVACPSRASLVPRNGAGGRLGVLGCTWVRGVVDGVCVCSSSSPPLSSRTGGGALSRAHASSRASSYLSTLARCRFPLSSSLVIPRGVPQGIFASVARCRLRVLLPYPCRLRSRRCSSLSVPGGRLLYFEKIRVFKAGVKLEPV